MSISPSTSEARCAPEVEQRAIDKQRWPGSQFELWFCQVVVVISVGQVQRCRRGPGRNRQTCVAHNRKREPSAAGPTELQIAACRGGGQK
jgi:hypothetical protein